MGALTVGMHLFENGEAMQCLGKSMFGPEDKELNGGSDIGGCVDPSLKLLDLLEL